MIQKKLAIFVEGQTERMFVARLLQEIAGYKRISINIYQFQGGKSNRQVKPINSSIIENSPFFVLLYDCGCDSHVISDIRKQHLSLSNNGYEKIIGLRDLYPELLINRIKVENGIKGFLKSFQKMGIPISIILAVMEIEAWFIAEWNFFSKIDSCLTPDFILQNCGFDLRSIDVEQRAHPSQDLDCIYQQIQRTYDKSETTVKEIVNSLNYEFMYLQLVQRVKQLKLFIDEIDDFLQ